MTKGVKSVKLTREKALAKIPMSVHKQYNLLNAVYTGSTQPMTGVICPIHGEVSVPYRKLREGCGCKRCGQIAAGKKRRKLCNGGLMPNVNFNKMTLLEVLEGFPKEIRRRYDFSQAVYRNASVPITDIICREHGKFKRHSSLLRKGKGCQHCAYLQELQRIKELKGKTYKVDKPVTPQPSKALESYYQRYPHLRP